jgi:hypothetical protein
MASLTEQLQSAGYRIVIEQRAWWHCLIDEDGASWTGEGADAERAARAAFQRMVPSRIARDGLLAQWNAQAPLVAAYEEELSTPPHPEVTAATTAVVMEEARILPPPPPADESSSAQVELVADSEPKVEALAVAPAEVQSVEASVSAPDVAHREPALPMTDHLEYADVRGLLDELEEELEVHADDVGLWAPQIMRLMMLHWIARARACEDACGNQSDVCERVHDVARTIAGWAKRYWPGTVDALQVEQVPEGSWRFLGHAALQQPRTWTAVAECALAEVARVLAAGNVDEDGWADHQALEPRHPNPDAVLHDIGSRLKALLPCLDGDVRQQHRTLARTPALAKELVDMAKRLRWLRGSVSDETLWAECMGKLRHLAWDANKELPGLTEVLGEHWVPSQGTWARACGQDPQKKARQKKRRSFHDSRPDITCSDEELQRWLKSGLAVMTAQELVEPVRPFAERVSGWDDRWLKERNERTKWRKLVQKLRSTEQPSAAAPANDDEGEELAEHPVALSFERPARSTSQETLRQRVLVWTRGQRILLVNNRSDPALCEALQSELEAEDVEGVCIDDRRLHTAAERVRNRSYGLVLCATGFMSHKAEGKIHEACNDAEVPYVRVGKGRPVTVIRRLGQTLCAHDEQEAAN